MLIITIVLTLIVAVIVLGRSGKNSNFSAESDTVEFAPNKFLFIATENWDIPLKYLKMDGTMVESSENSLPKINPRYGCWTPIVDMPEKKEPSEYLLCLMSFRELIESKLPIQSKKQKMKTLADHFPAIRQMNDDCPDWLDSFFDYNKEIRLPKLSNKTAKILYENGYRNPETIQTSLDEIKKLKGIGQKSLEAIKENIC